MDPIGALVPDQVGAQPIVQAHMGAFDQQVVVHFAQHRSEAIGIIEAPFAGLVAGEQPIGRRTLAPRGQAFEHPGGMAARQDGDRAAGGVAGLQLERARRKGADDDARLDHMGAEDGERVSVERADDRFDLALIQAPALGGRDRQVFITGTFQMSSAYSRIARSDENHPMWATFSMADRRHDAGSAQSRSTSRCLAA